MKKIKEFVDLEMLEDTYISLPKKACVFLPSFVCAVINTDLKKTLVIRRHVNRHGTYNVETLR